MKKILFVCTGNTCRSCMAEAVFNKLCNIDGMEAVSAGIHVVRGSVASPESVKVLNKYMNMDINGRKAVQVTYDILKNSYMILTMTKYIKEILLQKFPDFRQKIFTLREIVSLKGDISDPFGKNTEVYEFVYKQIEASILLLLRKLKEDTGII